MVNERYGIAIAETLHYLKGINQEDINKIPNKFMIFLKENANENYKCGFDYTKSLNELDLKNETRGLIAMICLNYWCRTDEEKEEFRKHLNENEKKYQEELSQKYNIDNVFKRKNPIEDSEDNISKNELPIVIEKENVFKKIIIFLKGIFHIK